MSDEVKRICEEWAKAGLANECFWEGWPECPTPQDSLTPAMVLDRIEALEAQLAQANAALKLADDLVTQIYQGNNIRPAIYDYVEARAPL